MKHIDRRTLLASALSGLTTLAARSASSSVARLTLKPEVTLNRLPVSYNGFSIETATLENPDVYHPANSSLVTLFRQLTPHGVLRLGGNSSEFCWWKANE